MKTLKTWKTNQQQSLQFVFSPSLSERKEELSLLLNQENIWNQNLKEAQSYSKELSFIENNQNQYNNLNNNIQDLKEILLDEEEFLILINEEVNDLEKNINEFVKNLYFSNKHDKNNCYLNIKAGSGGMEAMDFVSILMQMYLKFLTKNNINHEIINISYNDNLIYEVSILINTEYAYGCFKEESGIHRLTRVSPFGNGKLHTSFAEVSIIPIIESNIDISINKKDIRIDTYRGSGAGGQHRNKTDSAVRITHIPTGIVTQCEGERSQHYNKDIAMKQLISKLTLLEEEKNKEISSSYKNDLNSHWGNQIRSYLYNNNIVKDHKNGNEYNINSFLEGNIDNKYIQYIS